MKDSIENFKKSIRFIVVIFTSREFAFIYALIGTITQVAHTYFLTSSISSFTGGFRVFQATLLSIFISSSLMYFVAIIDNSDTKENRNNKLAVNIFAFVEILINLYYYSRHLLIDAVHVQIFDFIFAVLVSGFIPVTIKLYGSQIRAKEWIDDILTTGYTGASNDSYTKTEIEEFIEKKLIEFKESINNVLDIAKIEEIFQEKTKEIQSVLLSNIDKDVSGIFNKNQQLFLQQFENKAKLIMDSIIKPEGKPNGLPESTN
jgi:hypothetical protein